VDARIVGVTGTNGKSTTVGVIGAILTAGGFRVTVAGNVGTPFSDVVDEPCDVFVLELSSFQLDTIDRFRVDVAVLLNVTPDHLDRYHHSFDEYAASKKRILNRSGVDTWLVYNEDDRVCTETAAGFDGHKLGFSSTTRLEQGMCLEDGAIVLAWGSDRQRVVERSEFTPIGIHNAENAMAAIGAATAFGVEPDAIRSALRGYRALPHRMELVRVVAGVGYVNDSKATNVDATVKSLRSIEGGVVLILGGRDKEGDFKALIPHLGNVRKVILIGEAGRVIHTALEGSCDLEDAADMASAVARATASAVPGDTVLLAPACASFDMFDNYQARGQAFRNSVNAISTAKG
jgi:UDP-N-acetylmuramoylalanine--D-glutamate ligase